VRALVILAALAAITSPAAAQQVEVTLDEAVRRALEVQPAMVQARGDVRTAGADARAATGAFLPDVQLSASSQHRSTSQDPGSSAIFTETQYTNSVSVDLDLFDGFRRLAVRRAASASQEAANAGMIDQRFQVTLATKQAFYDAVAREDLVRVAEAQVRRAEQQRQISVQKLLAGSATRSDSLRATVDLGNARLALLQARANLATAQADLGRQVGVDGPVRARSDSVFPRAPDTTDLRSVARATAPQVLQAEAQAREARAQIGAARSQYWPTFRVSYSASRNGAAGPPWNSFDTYTPVNRLQFSLNWTLFNGFTREANQVSAAVQRDNADARAADARRSLQARLTQHLAALFTAYEQIDISAATVAAATEDLRVQQERYRVGAATILDLLTSQANLTQAEVNLVQSRFNALLARAEVEALVGRTL